MRIELAIETWQADELRALGDFILDLQGQGIPTPYDEGGCRTRWP